ncbi:hypothetical protein GXW74_15800 [Roseomonas eburnea]|uniref:Uncharacterized protein n=1 Tax=Neoroseomonas eburnea TaxID=1346889 RepID=A0A9X9XE23_9PROT|nr:hypothetical protein [Neoroseomonas eburnea]MBR0681959.1 hypothetical protein [Neoroseomonas eburnea]
MLRILPDYSCVRAGDELGAAEAESAKESARLSDGTGPMAHPPVGRQSEGRM